METIVQKYGGSSLADDSQLRAVALRVAQAQKQGHRLVVVVSARGDTTSRLLASAGRLNAKPALRELDMLLAAGEQTSASLLSLTLQDLGIDACAMTGPQAGVRTCGSHLNARIRSVDPARIFSALDRGKVVVVAGFQGASPEGDITTLGRGGSDTTAVAIAAAIKARRCEIYSDVDGVYTADPRLVPDAIRLDLLSLVEMKTLAHHGAGVLNERAIDYASQHGVTIHARRAHGDGGQTVVRRQAAGVQGRVVGIAAHRRLFNVSPGQSADRSALAAALADYELFMPELAEAADPRFALPVEQLADIDGLTGSLLERFGADIELDHGLASVSAVGHELGRNARLTSFARELLESYGVEPLATYTQAHALVCLIASDQVAAAAQALHTGLGISNTEVADVA